jgi:hypothetical protein
MTRAEVAKDEALERDMRERIRTHNYDPQKPVR